MIQFCIITYMIRRESGADLEILALQTITGADVADIVEPARASAERQSEKVRFDIAKARGLAPEMVHLLYSDGPVLDPRAAYREGLASIAFAAERWNFPRDPSTEADKPTLL